MAAGQGKNHFYSATEASGVVVYVIDEDEPVCLKFGKTIKIKVLFDSSDSWSEFQGTRNGSFDFISEHAETEEVQRNDLMNKMKNVLTCDGEEESGVLGVKDVKEIQTEVGKNASEKLFVEKDNEDYTEADTKGLRTSQNNSSRVALPRRGKRNMATRPAKLGSNTSHGKAERGRKEMDAIIKENEPVQIVSESVSQSGLENQSDRTKVKRLSKLKVNSYSNLKKRLRASKTSAALLKSVKKVKSSKLGKNQTRIGNLDEENERIPSVRVRPRKLLECKTVKCEYCEVDFKNQQEYYNHRKAEESVHKCGICGKVEPYEAHLIVHMQKHRRVKVDVSLTGENSQQNTNSDNLHPNKKKKSKKEKMKCNVCGLVVSSIDSLKIHTMLHTGEFAYRCCVCGENFSSLSSRQHHMDTHVSAQRFKCNPCEQRFASRAELAKHQLTHEIKCALCGEVFPNRTSRTCHFRVSHPNDILKCSVCSSMFATEEDLRRHLLYHRKGKREQCPVCGIVVAKLKDHMLLHNQMAQEKMYVCDQCPMRYLRKSNLDRHMRTHTGEKPYACDRCPKRFRSNGMLRKHLLTHTQERPYQCEVCGKRCSLRSNLNIHMRVHSNDRHFSCTMCPQAFNHKNSLMGHMKNKHSREMSLQDMQMDLPVNPPHQQPPPSHPNLPPDMNKIPVDPNNRQMHLGLPVGMASNLDSEMLIKMETHQDYSQIQMQLNYPPNVPVNPPSSLLMDTGRMPIGKYTLQHQPDQSHGGY